MSYTLPLRMGGNSHGVKGPMATHDSALLPLSIFEHYTRYIEFHML